MINDFILTYDNIFSKDECEDYIDRINHYINAGIVFKEDYDKLHNRDHYTINFNNHDHPEFNVLAGDNLSLHFLPKIKKPIDDYLSKFSALGREKLLIYDAKLKKILQNTHVSNGIHTCDTGVKCHHDQNYAMVPGYVQH